jgi:hypothetical protein
MKYERCMNDSIFSTLIPLMILRQNVFVSDIQAHRIRAVMQTAAGRQRNTGSISSAVIMVALCLEQIAFACLEQRALNKL